MVTAEMIENLTLVYFHFLEEKYSFDFVGTYDAQRVVHSRYKKGKLTLQIEYSHVNKTIEITIIKNKDDSESSIPNAKNSISLRWIMKKKDTEYDYTDYVAVTPVHLPLEDSMERLSSLLMQYGDELLSGREWYTWGDVSGWSNNGDWEIRIHKS